MPYKTKKEFPPTLAGFDPALTVSQANDIADMADAIGTDETKNGWAIAISTFKKTHKSSDGKWVKKEMAELAEGEYGDTPEHLDFSSTTFAQYEMKCQAEEVSENLRDLLGVYKMLLSNVLYDFEIQPADKLAAFGSLTAEFQVRLQKALKVEPEMGEAAPMQETAQEPVELAESESGAVIMGFSEAGEAQTDLLYLDTAIIQPGWGNQRDNNFYPREMLSRDASKFVGAKMYETDHREEEKSTRTWVSTVTEIKGFTDDGAPIARVAIHDPGFAQRVRNLNQAGLLQKMECSILAMGRAKAGFEADGRKGNMVEELTEVLSVDWVTRAGAGGKALNLSETDAQPETETETETQPEQEQAPENQSEPENQTQGASEENGTESVQETPDGANQDTEMGAQENEPVAVSLERVQELLAETRLPEPAKAKLVKLSFQTEDAVKEAVQSEIAYLKEITASGKPFAMGETAAPKTQTVDMAEVERRKDAVNKKYLA